MDVATAAAFPCGMRWPGGEAVPSMRAFLEGPSATGGASMLCYEALLVGRPVGAAARASADPRALDDALLLQLGVEKVFHRKRILRWARLLQGGGAVSGAAPQPAAREPTVSAPQTQKGPTVHAEDAAQHAPRAGESAPQTKKAVVEAVVGGADVSDAAVPTGAAAWRVPEIGDVVRVHGLQSSAGQALNGCRGVVREGLDARTGRCVVELHNGLASPQGAPPAPPLSASDEPQEPSVRQFLDRNRDCLLRIWQLADADSCPGGGMTTEEHRDAMRSIVLPGFKEMNWHIAEGVELLWRGERCPETLCAAVPHPRDSGSRAVLKYILNAGGGAALPRQAPRLVKLKPENLGAPPASWPATAAAATLVPLATTAAAAAAPPVAGMPPFPRLGVRLKVLRQLARKHGSGSGGSSGSPGDAAGGPQRVTTNYLCHEVVRGMTVPHGWRDVPTLADAAKGWYSHEYERIDAPGGGGGATVKRKAPPAGTCSYASLLQQSAATRHLVGRATHFVSHAWRYVCGTGLQTLAPKKDHKLVVPF